MQRLKTTLLILFSLIILNGCAKTFEHNIYNYLNWTPSNNVVISKTTTIETYEQYFPPFDWFTEGEFSYEYSLEIVNIDTLATETLADFVCSSLSWVGNYIVYQDSGIWRMNSDGSNQVLLDSQGERPKLSSDATKILYNKNDAVWIMDINGTDEKSIEGYTNSYYGIGYDWYNGTQEVIIAERAIGFSYSDIYIVDVSSTVVELSETRISGYYTDWSAVNEKILYCAKTGNLDIRYKLLMSNTDGTGETLVSEEFLIGGSYSIAKWSPDCNYILVGRTVMDSNGNNSKIITPNE